MKYWLMKSEPSAYAIDDLKRDGKTSWEGVRNFQARNFMRDEMHAGDPVLFYASSADPSGVTGIAEIIREAYPDKFATQKGHKYFDEKATKDNPIWYMVDIGFIEKFPQIVPLDTLKTTKGLEKMVVTQRGSRLSIQPVTKSEFEIVCRMGRKA
jgi:predicted RNA-binding protein with PUA-like domain